MSNGNTVTKPPALLFAITCLLLLITLVLFRADGLDFGLPFTDRSGDRNTVGFLVGSVLGTAMLGAFLIQDNVRRSTMRYSDWSFLSPRVYAPYITGVTWALGVLHMFFWAKDLTRA
jgi:hypothetical protein